MIDSGPGKELTNNGSLIPSAAKHSIYAIKLKTCGLSLDEELVRIRATREAIGDALLMLDMNAPYDVQECIRFAKAVAPYNICWLEEPLHWYLQPADYVRLAAAVSIPLAHGEREQQVTGAARPGGWHEGTAESAGNRYFGRDRERGCWGAMATGLLDPATERRARFSR